MTNTFSEQIDERYTVHYTVQSCTVRRKTFFWLAGLVLYRGLFPGAYGNNVSDAPSSSVGRDFAGCRRIKGGEMPRLKKRVVFVTDSCSIFLSCLSLGGELWDEGCIKPPL
jgi:hypothetical protein